MDVEVEETGDDDPSDEEGVPVGRREWSTNVPARCSTTNILGPGNADVEADARAAEDIVVEARRAARSPSNDPRTAVVTRRFSTQLL